VALRALSNEVLQAVALAGAVQSGIPVTLIDRRRVPTVRHEARQLVREIDAFLAGEASA
jgi:hypothetical protein